MRKITSEEFFKNKRIIWDERDEKGAGEIRLWDDGIFKLNDNQYPKYFQYESSEDAHFCGTWIEASQEDYYECIRNRIKTLNHEISVLTEELTK